MINYSLLAIPAMWLTNIYPHFYSVLLIRNANSGRFDNANAKGHAFIDAVQKKVPAEVMATYERCQSAHRNGFENMPLFFAAVLAANVTGVAPHAIAVRAWAFVGLRVLYNLCYMNITSYKKSFLRTLCWMTSVVVCFDLLVRAALE